ncbi:MAG: PAS domain-containing sensor histidine kinase [Anderseniella sp.]|jgi:two-component system nitrogen regulation sensor histidine kinase NtrY|nr:PAS domain-containing sensor histidine kinase [Anderseniella sp.]
MSAVSGITDASAGSGRPEAATDTLIDNRVLNWIALGLVVVALALGLGTYLYLTGILPVEPDAGRARELLYANIVLLLLMGGIIIWQVSRLARARMRRVAGSGLHIRIVTLLSLFAVLPAIVVAVFATVTLSRGLDTWLSGKTEAIVTSAEAVAEAYITENMDVARSDAAFIANELNQRADEFRTDREKIVRRVATYGALRGLAGLFVVNPSTKEVLISATASNAVRFRPPPPEDLAQATTGDMVVRQPERGGNVIRALMRLEKLEGNYLYLYRLVNPDVIAQLEKARSQRKEFADLIAQREALTLNFAALFAGLALIFLMSAVLLGLMFSNRLVQPIVSLVSAARRVSAGDLETKVSTRQATGDLATLGQTFNQMTDRLKSQRQDLITANDRLDERRRFMEAVLRGVSAGVIGLDPDGTITLTNRSALELLELDGESLTGKPIAGVFGEAIPIFNKAKVRPDGFADGSVKRRVGDQERSFVVSVTTEQSDAGVDGYVLTFDDTTELESAQRNSAWADIARRIAHEIKNPLTPIQLSAERLRRKYGDQITGDRAVFDQCTDTIVRQVGDIGRMVDEFSSFARMPSAQLEPNDLTALIREALVLQKASDETLQFETDFPDQPVNLRLDRRLVNQAMTNLVKNARESIETRLQRQPDLPGAIRIELDTSMTGRVVVRVMDNGIGLPQENRSRLTEPYMTTREKGTGLGLAIVTRIMEEHDGRLTLNDAPQSFYDGMGACVSLEFPAHQDGSGTSEDHGGDTGNQQVHSMEGTA